MHSNTLGEPETKSEKLKVPDPYFVYLYSSYTIDEENVLNIPNLNMYLFKFGSTSDELHLLFNKGRLNLKINGVSLSALVKLNVLNREGGELIYMYLARVVCNKPPCELTYGEEGD